MKTAIAYRDAQTHQLADCGEPLVIEMSSRDLGWQGLLVEKGWSPVFHPRNVYTECFYFALATTAPTEWQATEGRKSRLVKAEPGEIWLNPPRSAFTHDVDLPCFFTIVLVSEELLFRSFGTTLVGLQLNFLNQYNIRDPVLTRILELFEREASLGGLNGSPYLRNLVNLLADYFIRNYSDFTDQLARAQYSTLNSQKMATLDAYICEHLAEDVQIASLAAVCGMSKFHFLKEFKKLNGVTPYQYLLRKRVSRVETLLREGDSLSLIALQAGFSDQSHLTRVFKALNGESPGKFRRKILQ